MAAGNVAGIINVFDLEAEKLLTQIRGHCLPIRAVAFSPDSKLLLSGSDDTQIKIYQSDQGEQVQTLSGHASWILDLSFSPNGSHIASGLVLVNIYNNCTGTSYLKLIRINFLRHTKVH